MNKTKIILGAATIAAIAGGVYLSRTIGNQSIKNYKMSSHFEEEYEEEEEKEEFWGEARKYWEFLHTNVNTGQVEVADYLNAKNLALSIPRTKTGLVFSEMGPDNIGGRTRAIEIDPNNDNLVFAGSVSGGLFVSTDQGNNWNRVQGFDDAVPVTSISSIAISKNSTIYVGCGFSDFSDGFQTCQGIYFSTDGGANWSQLSGTSGKCVNKIVADRSKTDAIYYTAGSGNYLTRVENASTGTATSTSIGTSAGITVQGSAGRDIKISPDGQNLLYLSSNKVYVSNDGGATFSDKTGTTTGLVNATGMNRLEGAVSFDKTSNGKYTMSIVMSSSGNWGGAYFSKDNGVTWSQIAPKWVNNANIPTEQQFNPLNSGGRSPQGNYDLVCTIVPGDPYTMVFGGIDLYRWRMTPNSNPVAGQFERISFWYLSSFMPNYVHADIHRLTWSQDGKLFTGSDGGVSKSIDTSLSIFSVSNKGYNVTQFYGISYGPDGEGIGGAQDNGTLYNENPEWNKSSLEMTGGDGFECELSQLKNGAFVSSIYFSDIYRASSYTSGVASIAAPCGTSTHGLDCGSFSTILRLYEDDNDLDSKDFIEYHTDTLMPAGSVIKYQSANFDLPLTYTLTAPLTAGSTIDLQDPVQSLFITGTGTGIYITRDLWRFGGSFNYSKLLSVSGFSTQASSFEFSKDGNTVWIGLNGGGLYRVTNLDSAYTVGELDVDSANFKLDIQLVTTASTSITDISVDPTDPNKVAYTVSGSGGGGNIYYSSNAMATSPTFTSKDGNLPTYVAYGCEIISDPSNNITMVVGTEFGAYSTTSNLSGSVTWSPCTAETGVVPVYDVRQQWRPWGAAFGNVKNPGRIYLGTFGRGIWYTDDVAGAHGPSTLENAEGLNQISNVNIYPNPLSDNGNITFTLKSSADVTIVIYNLQGKAVRRIVLNDVIAGNHNISFNAEEFAAGTYLVAFTSNDYREVKKFIKK